MVFLLKVERERLCWLLWTSKEDEGVYGIIGIGTKGWEGEVVLEYRRWLKEFMVLLLKVEKEMERERLC